MKRSSRPKRPSKVKRLDIAEHVHRAAMAVCDAARKLPGLYVADADGRPGFTSQAAADLANALNAIDAARAGTTPPINVAPNGSVSAHLSKGNT